MESESGRLKWLLKPLFFLYLMVCLFFLFKNNPYLYSTETLKGIFHKDKNEMAHAVPEVNPSKNAAPERQPSSEQSSSSAPTQIDPSIQTTFQWRQNSERTGALAEEQSLHYKYEKVWLRDLWVNGDPEFKKAQFAWDETGYYLFANTNQLVKTDPDGMLLWRLRLAEEPARFGVFPIITKSRVYATTENGRVFCLDKNSGQIKWTVKAAIEIRGAPVLAENHLLYFGVREEGLKKKTYLFQTDPHSGSTAQISNEDVGPINSYPPTLNHQLHVLYVASHEGNLFALNYLSGKLVFKTSTSDKILSAVLLAEKKLAFTTMDGKLVAVDAKTGTLAWESELESPTDSTPAYIPAFNYLSVLTNNGYLQAVDFNSGEKLWKFLAHNESPHHNTMSARLNNKSIEQHDMKWRNKGYVIFAPCASKRICIYNPDKGRIVSRIFLDGEMASEPTFDGKFFMVTVKTDDNGNLKLMRLGESRPRHSVNPAAHNNTERNPPSPGES